MLNHEYQDLILKVSSEIAREFTSNERDLPSRALFLDADIAELTRQIGLKTTSIVLESARDEIIKKNIRRVNNPKKSKNLLQCDFWKNRN